MSDTTSKIKNLLLEVESISRRYEELEKLKGENFNVFQIFNMESDENKMHSRFIETLLNPIGPHGLGSIFLEFFLAEINFSNYFTDVNIVNTKVEHTIGKLNKDGMDPKGGRIDIFIWNTEKSISIENKIYASDQEEQIVRYANHNKGRNKVLYLTLDGKEPSKNSKGKLKSNLESDDPDFYCISYSATIINWLYKCQKEASDLPIIRETIKQYIITIKRLTGQLTNQKMGKELHKLIIDNYEESIKISRNIENAKIEVINDFLNYLKSKLETNLGIEWVIDKQDVKIKDSRLIVRKEDWPEGVKIQLQPQNLYIKHITILGIIMKKEYQDKFIKSLGDEVFTQIKIDFPKGNTNWFLWKNFFDLSKDSTFKKLIDSEERIEFTDSLSKQFIDLSLLVDNGIKKMDL